MSYSYRFLAKPYQRNTGFDVIATFDMDVEGDGILFYSDYKNSPIKKNKYEDFMEVVWNENEELNNKL